MTEIDVCNLALTRIGNEAILQEEWEAETYYYENDIVWNDCEFYICTTAGESGTTGPTGKSSGIIDGDAEWDWYTDKMGKPEKTIARLYQNTRDEILRLFPWTFAVSTAIINSSLSDNWTNYQNVYDLPEDCLVALSIGSSLFSIEGRLLFTNALGEYQEVVDDWEAETEYNVGDKVDNDDGDRYICTTAGTSGSDEPTWTLTTVEDGSAVWAYVESEITLKYIKKVEDPDSWDALFLEALIARLASKLVIPLKAELAYHKVFYEEYVLTLNRAKQSDGIMHTSPTEEAEVWGDA